MTTDNEQTTLKPCPFCGVTPVRRDHVYRYGSIAQHPEGMHCPIENTTIGVKGWNTRVSAASTAPVVDAEIYADGYCARCSELAYPLTRALEATGVPTGETNWQQTYGPNKVRALSDLETCLRQLLFALEEGTPEEIKKRTERANHYIEFHAAVRRRLTAASQAEDNTPAAASPVTLTNSIDPIGDFVEKVWALTNDRDGWSRITLRGLAEGLARHYATPTPSLPARDAAREFEYALAWAVMFFRNINSAGCSRADCTRARKVAEIFATALPAAAETVGEREDKEKKDA